MGLQLENEVTVVKTLTIISYNPVYMRNISGILNMSNKEMVLKLCKIVAGQGSHTSARIYSSRLRKDSTQWT